MLYTESNPFHVHTVHTDSNCKIPSPINQPTFPPLAARSPCRITPLPTRQPPFPHATPLLRQAGAKLRPREARHLAGTAEEDALDRGPPAPRPPPPEEGI